MADTVSLTAFEEQVLQALYIAAGQYPGLYSRRYFTSYEIYARNIQTHGDGWGGAAVERMQQLPFGTFLNCTLTYPKINGALGRLDRKGLVERDDWAQLSGGRYTSGIWRLSPMGRVLMGMDP